MALTMNEFTDKLLSEKIFACVRCNNLLTCPILLVERLGNVCHECATQQHLKGINNKNLEDILQYLEIPCQFNPHGCQERVNFSLLKEHEENCAFHERPCLVSSCFWKGVETCFTEHFLHAHSEDVVNCVNGVFSIDLNLKDEVNVIKLLKSKHNCILRIQKDSSNLLYSICKVEQPYCLEFSIKHIGKNGNCVKTKCPTSGLRELSEISINCDALRQVIEIEDVVTLHIKLCMNELELDFNESLLQYFECPVCKNLMRPPIYQCKFGHSFCSTCRPRLDSCPNCRGIFGTTRNYSLEGLTSKVQYTCMYRHLGCEETFLAAEVDTHETVCSFKPYPCPLDGCTFQGSHSNIANHLDQTHKDRVISGNFYRTTVEYRLEQLMDIYNFQQKMFLVFDENICKLSFKRNSDYSFWAVEVLKKRNENAVFTYEIGIVDMRNPDRKLTRGDLCFEEVNNDDLFKKCILFPNNILGSYSQGGVFMYYCEIKLKI